MLEVEVKYRTADWSPILEQLRQWQAEFQLSREDTDTYFNAPDRDFKQTDEAVRLRQIGEQNFLTYKGPKRDTATKTRREIEVPLAPGAAAAALAQEWLLSLGYRRVATVCKNRQLWRFQRAGMAVEACLDELPEIGQFVELEIQAEESCFAEAQAVVLQTATELGLHDQERRSYLEIILQRQEGKT